MECRNIDGLVSLHFSCLAFTFQNHQACPNVELMSTITFSHAKGSLQTFIDLQDTQTRHQASHLSTKENNVGNVIVALMADLAPKTKVLSDGKWSEKEAPILVPSDITSIKLGDIIPVDARLLEGDSLRVNQAALTGKSLTVGHSTSRTRSFFRLNMQTRRNQSRCYCNRCQHILLTIQTMLDNSKWFSNQLKTFVSVPLQLVC